MKSKFCLPVFIICALSLIIPYNSNSQVLISLLLGDKLNSPNLEFGLEGGVNWSNIQNIEEAQAMANFHLGFYFDIRIKNNWFLHTGVRVKSNLGAKGINVYPTGDSEVDSLFANGAIKRKFGYFHVPISLKYRFNNNFFVEGGVQLGLLYSAHDIFIESVYEEEDAGFRLNVRDEYKRLDVGLGGGIGYKIMKNTGMSVGAYYYYGLTNIYKDANKEASNSSIYLYVDIPIGKGAAEKKRQESE